LSFSKEINTKLYFHFNQEKWLKVFPSKKQVDDLEKQIKYCLFLAFLMIILLGKKILKIQNKLIISNSKGRIKSASKVKVRQIKMTSSILSSQNLKRFSS